MVEPITTFGTVALSAAATKAIESSTAKLIERLPFKFAKDKIDVIRFNLKKGLPKYLSANYSKCETLKTLLNRNDPIPIEECFVAPDFKLKEEVLSSENFLEKISDSNQKIIITGLAGSGKSVYLKHTFRKVIEKRFSLYPLFFELRSLNRAEPKKRYTFIRGIFIDSSMLRRFYAGSI